MHEKIADIQNSFWKAYKDFMETKDVNQWSDDVGRILEKYRHDEQPYFSFCEGLLYSWSGIMSVMRVMEGIENEKR